VFQFREPEQGAVLALDLMERLKRYPFPNVGKWTFRITADKERPTQFVHAPTVSEVMALALKEGAR
jgi:hypothetical protein